MNAFVTYCKLKGYRSPCGDNYGWARLAQVIGNFLGGELSIGMDTCNKLDCDNGNNGVYFIRNWEIVGRQYNFPGEQKEHDLREMLHAINKAQPVSEQIKDLDSKIDELLGESV